MLNYFNYFVRYQPHQRPLHLNPDLDQYRYQLAHQVLPFKFTSNLNNTRLTQHKPQSDPKSPSEHNHLKHHLHLSLSLSHKHKLPLHAQEHPPQETPIITLIRLHQHQHVRPLPLRLYYHHLQQVDLPHPGCRNWLCQVLRLLFLLLLKD